MTQEQELVIKKFNLAKLKESPKNIKCGGVVRKRTRQVLKLEQKLGLQ